ncbi:hypothetical protein SNEBB_002304 [Seison nebaliae]|nr:hypothetical protein SNEBB_002304 [Seison nebaliae]
MKFFILVTFYFVQYVDSRIHSFNINNDRRPKITLASFGLLKNGIISFKISNFNHTLFSTQETVPFSFVLERTYTSYGRDMTANYYGDTRMEACGGRTTRTKKDKNVGSVIFTFLNNEKKIKLDRKGKSVEFLQLLNKFETMNSANSRISSFMRASGTKDLSDISHPSIHHTSSTVDISTMIPLSRELSYEFTENKTKINFEFSVLVQREDETGQYSFYFLNCADKTNHRIQDYSVNFHVNVYERNYRSFLSADEAPLPYVYFALSVIFFLIANVWLFVLLKRHQQSKVASSQSSNNRIDNNRQEVYKKFSNAVSATPVLRIHWLMLSLIYVKSLSLMLHSLNLYYIGVNGRHERAWAILYYIVHLCKGLLFGRKTIILSKGERSEESVTVWRNIFFLVDLLCCGAVFVPIIWSVRHLQRAAVVDGKLHSSLAKLRIFRHFYTSIIIYIYFTRIIVFLIKIIVSFDLGWLDELFAEIATAIFFVITGYQFRPTLDNPRYMRLAQHLENNSNDNIVSKPSNNQQTTIHNEEERMAIVNLSNLHLAPIQRTTNIRRFISKSKNFFRNNSMEYSPLRSTDDFDMTNGINEQSISNERISNVQSLSDNIDNEDVIFSQQTRFPSTIDQNNLENDSKNFSSTATSVL